MMRSWLGVVYNYSPLVKVQWLLGGVNIVGWTGGGWTSGISIGRSSSKFIVLPAAGVAVSLIASVLSFPELSVLATVVAGVESSVGVVIGFGTYERQPNLAIITLPHLQLLLMPLQEESHQLPFFCWWLAASRQRPEYQRGQR